MSKIIKPSDKKLFKSVKKFEKAPLTARTAPPEGGRGPVAPGLQPEGEKVFFDGLKQLRPEDLIEQAERRAEQIVREAEKQAEHIRLQAREEGRAKGNDEAKQQNEQQTHASKLLLDSLVTQLKTQEAELMQLLTPRLASLATELAEKILRREIQQDSSVVVRQSQEAISRIVEREKLVIRTNPADENIMKQHKSALTKMFDGIDKIEIIADPKIERGGCVVETDLIRVDAQPSSQLEAARKALLGEAQA